MLIKFIWEMLSSRTAIGLYALVVLALVVALVIAVLRTDAAHVSVVAPEGSGKKKQHSKRSKAADDHQQDDKKFTFPAQFARYSHGIPRRGDG